MGLWSSWPAGLDAWSGWWLTLLVSPLLEELVFRGGLQEWALRRGLSPYTANLLAAVAFAAAHMVNRPVLAAALLVAPGCFLGMLYQRYRSVWVCAAAHMVMNALWLGWQAF